MQRFLPYICMGMFFLNMEHLLTPRKAEMHPNLAYTNNYSYILNAPIDIRSGGNFRTRHGSNAIAQAYTVLNTISEVESINSNGNHVLGSNIDARETVDWNDGKGYDPIYPFYGTFDGLGHVVDGLCINRPDQSYNGLFGALFDDARVSNVGVTNIYYNVMGYAGSLVGYAFDRSQISNTFSSGLIHTQLENTYISSHARIQDGEMSNSFSFASAKGGYTVEFSNGRTVNSYYRGYINDVLATSQWLSSYGNKVTITDHELKTNWPSWGVNNGTTYPRFNWIDFDPQADTSFSPIDFMAIEENQPAGTMITQFKHTYPDANVTLTVFPDDPDGNTSNHLFCIGRQRHLKIIHLF